MTSPGASTPLTFRGFFALDARAHLTPSSGILPTWRSRPTAPPGSPPGWKPMRADCSLGSSTTARRQGPGGDVVEGAHVGKLHAPVAADVDLLGGAAEALRLVVADESVGQRLMGDHLHLGIERGAHRQAALIESLLAVFLVDFAAH